MVSSATSVSFKDAGGGRNSSRKKRKKETRKTGGGKAPAFPSEVSK